MKYFLITVLLCVGFGVKNVFGLNCYATDFEKVFQDLKTGGGNVTQEIQSCEENMKKIAHFMVEGSTPQITKAPLNCFSLDFKQDTLKNLHLKGCLPEGGCKIMKLLLLAANIDELQDDKVDCSECNGNLCNSAKSVFVTVYLIALSIVVSVLKF